MPVDGQNALHHALRPHERRSEERPVAGPDNGVSRRQLSVEVAMHHRRAGLDDLAGQLPDGRCPRAECLLRAFTVGGADDELVVLEQ